MIPKGIRTRSTPDWFALYLSTAGDGFQFAGTTWKYISLFNDSTDGAYLYCYGMQPVTGFAIFTYVYLIQGTVGTFIRPGTRINPTVGAPAGKVYSLDNGASQISAAPFTTIGSYTAPPPPSEYPLFILPAGYSLVSGSPQPEPTQGCNWWYIPFKDLKGTAPV